MSAVLLARCMVSAIAAGQGILPVFIDLNRTHATNPLWPGHARFHLVQQLFTVLPAAAIEVALVWWPGSALRSRFYLAALLAATPLAGFLVAAVSGGLYGGTLHDANGIKPLRVRFKSREFVFDLNVPIVVAASLVLVGAVLLFRLGQ